MLEHSYSMLPGKEASLRISKTDLEPFQECFLRSQLLQPESECIFLALIL